MKKLLIVCLLFPFLIISCEKECEPGLPKLLVRFSPVSGVVIGKIAEIDFLIVNIGDETNHCFINEAGKSHTLAIIYRNDEEFERDTIPTPGIKGKESWSGSFSFHPMVPGLYRGIIITDYFNEVIEDGE